MSKRSPRRADPARNERTIPKGAVLRMAVSSWDNFEATGPAIFPIRVKGPEGSLGFCEVFESLEAGIAFYGPNERFMPIEAGPPREVSLDRERRGE